jgi:carboxyl-terminal processing protease
MYKFNKEKAGSMKRFFASVAAVVILTFFFTTGYAFAAPIDEVRYILKNYYVDNVPDEVLNKPTIEEIIGGLGDPYTEYFTSKEFEGFENAINNKIVGIGIRVEMVPEGVKIIDVIENSPALKAGLKEGDIIISADEHNLAGLPSEEALSYIKGEEGSQVAIQVKRGNEILQFSVSRTSFTLPTVQAKIVNNNIGYINIETFGQNTAAEFENKLKEMERGGAQRYIIDLRNNTGGYLYTAIKIAGYFIGNKVALITKDRIDGEVKYYGEKQDITVDKPVIFLTNGYSASASEVLLGAVKDNKKAILIGTKTFGKGKVQSIAGLSDGGILKFTIQRFFSPLGKTIDKVGIAPDLPVTGEVDPFDVAVLLLGKPTDKVNREGYMQVKINGSGFAIDLNKARDKDYWKAYKYILNNISRGNLFLGTKKGWTNVDNDFTTNMVKSYFPGYKELVKLKDVPVDKKFNVAFSREVSIESLKNKGIELIDAVSGDRIPIEFEAVNSKNIKVIPKSSLEKGRKYYLVISQGVKDVKGQSLVQGTVTSVEVVK